MSAAVGGGGHGKMEGVGNRLFLVNLAVLFNFLTK